MNRRHFIRNTSLTAAAGMVAGILPAWALAPSDGQRRVVLAVVGGISREDFVALFPDHNPLFPGKNSRLITDMHYGGQAAGHRLALASLLNGTYLSESETGKTALTETGLFAADIPGPKFFVTGDRAFLKPSLPAGVQDVNHFYVKLIHNPLSKFPLPNVYNIDPTVQRPWSYQSYLTRIRPEHEFGPLISEDRFVGDVARQILREEKEAPRLLVTHFMGADAAHGDVSTARQNRYEISYALWHLWDAVCARPDMKDTLFAVISDFGRNTTPNGIRNAEGLPGSDHGVADENVRRIACLLAHPGGLPGTVAEKGESIDLLPTLLRFLQPDRPTELPGKSLL